MLQSGQAASIGVGISPAGVLADVYTAGTGEDYFTDEEVTGFWRWAGIVPGVSELRKGGKVLDAARGAANVADDALATGFRGSKGFELTNAPYQVVRNSPATIGGRQYTGHALDQMQNRGFMPSVVENTIRTGTTFPTRAGTSGYFDTVNRVRVIIDTATGRVVTVIPGGP